MGWIREGTREKLPQRKKCPKSSEKAAVRRTQIWHSRFLIKSEKWFGLSQIKGIH